METAASYVGNVIGLVILLGVSVWVFLDAKAIGTDNGRTPGIVNTKPGVWAGGVLLMLIVVLPLYLLMRFRYSRLLAERRAAGEPFPPDSGGVADTAGVWPPPPDRPAV